jgi:hypothetical protein
MFRRRRYVQREPVVYERRPEARTGILGFIGRIFGTIASVIGWTILIIVGLIVLLIILL